MRCSLQMKVLAALTSPYRNIGKPLHTALVSAAGAGPILSKSRLPSLAYID